jgi:4-hydroxybenzoate polyprenyltransferase
MQAGIQRWPALPVAADFPVRSDADVPLFVDLDGTLLKSDLLLESVLLLLKRNPLHGFLLLVWLLQGKARLKQEVARRVELDTALLPLQDDFVRYLRNEASRGRRIYLATAADRTQAEQVAKRLGVFAGVLASDGQRNLRGQAKLEAIRAATGGAAFDYAGNARADLRVWAEARAAIVVNPQPGVMAAARRLCAIEQVFDDRPPTARAWVEQLRLYQWLKNVLLGVPLLTAHVFTVRALEAIALAWLAMGCIASASYLVNDLSDLFADRRHPRKCRRPFAAGNLPLGAGAAVAAALLIAGFTIAASIARPFALVLLAYLVLTLAYSLHLKSVVLVDVIVLAALYTVRIIAGAFVIDVQMSSWLLAFSMFIFLSIALVKRSSELAMLGQTTRGASSGRDYRVGDNPIVTAMGIASGYLAVLVLALYIDSPQGRAAYAHPQARWLLCPALLYWVSRLWIKTGRGEMHDDPLLYSMRDRTTWLVVSAMVLITIAAIE